MKRFTFILSFLFAVMIAAISQSPNKINYQATIRNNSGQLLASKSVSMRISILQSSAAGTPVYSEKHIVTTTAQGIINLQIGSGTTSDDLSAISWNDGPYFLKVEVDPEGGNDFISMGTSEFLSVPYAMSANSAGKVNWTDVQNKPDFAIVTESGSYNDLVDKPIIPINTNELINGAGFMTSYTEIDPQFSLSPSHLISASDITHWNASFSWGNHSNAGYAILPPQTGNNNRYLMTNGSSTVWNYAVNTAGSPLYITNNTINIQKATTTTNGYLSKADWNLFNDKVSSQWNASGNDIYFNSGNVGIGINNPSRKLHIVSTSSDDENESRDLLLLRNLSSSNKAYTCLNLRADDDAYGLGISFTSSNYNLVPDFNQTASIGTNGKALALSVTSSDGSIKFLTNPNQTGLEEKMRMNTYGNLGIGTKNPLRKVHIETTSSDDDNESRDLLLLRNLSSSSNAYTCLNLRADDNAYGLGISFTSSNYSLIDDFQSTASIGTNGKALALSVTSLDGSIRFLTNPHQTGLIEMMRLDTQGNLGIGTTTPHSKLEIADGDVYIKDISSGIIMTSPDGHCWRGTINNSGVLEFTSIACP